MAVNLPTPGEKPWGEELNAAIMALDTRIVGLENASGGGGGGVDTSAAWFAGKDWYAMGTSLTIQGFYTAPLAALSGMILHNIGQSAQSLGQTPTGGTGAIWSAMVGQTGTDAEIITMETTNDWRLNVTLGDIDDPEDHTVSFYGALKGACKWILGNRPAARFFLLTNYNDAITAQPTYGNFYIPNNLGLFQWEYDEAIRKVAAVYGVVLIDVARDSGLNYFSSPYFTSDGLHLNTLGGTRFAEFVWSRMKSLDWGTSRPSTPTGETAVSVTGVTIAQGDALTMSPGQSQQLTVTIAPANATQKGVTWSSTNQSVATVTANGGLLTAVATGTANIITQTVDGGKTDTLVLTVAGTVPVTGVTLTPPTASIGVGATVQLTATVAPAGATNKNVSYVSSQPSKATVNSSGLVTGVALGSTTITVTTAQGSYSDTTSVTVATVVSEWEFNTQTSFRGIGLTGLTQGDDSPTYDTMTLAYAAILINSPGDNAIEFAVNNGAKGGGIVLGSNGDTDWISCGNVGVPLTAFNAKAAFAGGGYSDPGGALTPTPAAAGWATGTVYRVGRVGNRMKLARMSGGVPVTVWDCDLPTNYVGHDSKFATIDLGVLAYQTPETIYTLPIDCKTGTWTPS